MIEEKTKLEIELKKIAQSISNNRTQSALVLELELKNLVGKMGMPDAIFKIELNQSVEYLINGMDTISFQFCPNIGGQFNLLKKVPSGGELSRIMLGIKYKVSTYDGIETLIFDEIDTGVSGKIASYMGDLMLEISKKTQLISVTHLPQIAFIILRFRKLLLKVKHVLNLFH